MATATPTAIPIAPPTSTPTATPTLLPTATPTPHIYSLAVPAEGAYIGTLLCNQHTADQFQASYGRSPAIGFSGGLYLDGDAHPYFRSYIERDAGDGVVAIVDLNVARSWEDENSYTLPSGLPSLMNRFLAGEFDDNMRLWATIVKSVPMPVMVRFGREMNGDWYPWSGAENGAGTTSGYADPTLADGPERYTEAYRRVWQIFEAEGVENAVWVWTPTVPWWITGGYLAESWNDPVSYYPGDQYVDWTSVTLYYWGTHFGHEPDLPFGVFFEEAYNEIVVGIGKPFLISELGVGDEGVNKATWIRNTYAALKDRYRLVKGVVWWDDREWDLGPRIDSSPQSADAFRDAIADPYYLDRPILIPLAP
jgi:hypothetical protein